MSEILITINHNGTIFSPPIKDDVQIEWERVGVPGKLTFTTIKIPNAGMDFSEGDPVTVKCDGKDIFTGYVFTKSRAKEHHIKVTCYDQLRYLKNKFSYVFENKTATDIVKALAKDHDLNVGTIENTKYIIPAVAEENATAFDVILSAVETTLMNTGEMYTLYDYNGKLMLRNSANMISETLITKDTAENFDYSSSIDNETYNSVVLYYDPSSTNTSSGNGSSTSGSSDVNTILNIARKQIGVTESPKGSNRVFYNNVYYGKSADSTPYHKMAWCCCFVWWVFKEAGLSELFYGGNKTAYCPTLMSWFKSKGQFYKSNYKAGDIIFFRLSGRNGAGQPDHVGIVEKNNGDGTYTVIDGNYGNKVSRRTVSRSILGCGRPAYSGVTTAAPTAYDKSESTDANGKRSIQVYKAESKDRIEQWGLLRYFESVKDPSIGLNKANALLRLYNKKTRELTVKGAFGSTDVRAGMLIPVKLYLGDISVNNYMLIQKVVHKFKHNKHTMDLTLEGAWED